MPPKTETKGFRKQKGKAKGKAKKKQIVYVRAKQSQPIVLPAFSAVPQGFPGGVLQTPGIVVSPQISIPMAKPETIPDNTNQILAAYNNLLVQGAQAAQAQRFQEYRNTIGLNIQRPESGFRSTTNQGNIYGNSTIPSGYILNEPSITEQAVDDVTYDNPKVNNVLNNELDYAPQFPNVSSSASTRGFTLEEKQDNALSNLVAKEQLGKQEKQVESDLNNINEKDANEETWFDIIPQPKRSNKQKLPVQSSSSADAITEYSLEPPIVVTPAEKRRQTMQKKKSAEFSAKSEQTKREWEAFLAAEGPIGVNPFNLPNIRLTPTETGKPYSFV